MPLGARAYEIHIGAGLLQQIGDLIVPMMNRPKVAIIADETVFAYCGDALIEALGSKGIIVSHLCLPSGESTKSWPFLTKTVEWLLEQKIERSDLVLALGGGVIGDLVGFAAAILRRGVRFVQIPTTLLAQVDSSVGGKTAINSAAGKNLIGVFHQPVLVLVDIDLLKSLPKRDFLSGYGEVVKYGLLGDLEFFEWLEQNGPRLLQGDAEARVYAVKRSCEMKSDIVTRDETEQGDRALLNLGHTFAHALEAVTGYCDRLLHGEAVAIGCGLALDLSARLGLSSQEDPIRLQAHLSAMGMAASLRDIQGDLPDADALLSVMSQDKKVVAGKMRYILTRGIGQSFVADNVPADQVRAVLQEALALRNAGFS